MFPKVINHFFQFENPVVEKAGSALALITDTCEFKSIFATVAKDLEARLAKMKPWKVVYHELGNISFWHSSPPHSIFCFL